MRVFRSRNWVCIALFWIALLSLEFAMGGRVPGMSAISGFRMTAHAFGADQPIISVSRNALTPALIEVHVGELVRWRAQVGEHLHLQLDAHAGAHEPIGRPGEIRAMFLTAGTHTYEVSVSGGPRPLAGSVIVRESERPMERPGFCGPVSYKDICVQP